MHQVSKHLSFQLGHIPYITHVLIVNYLLCAAAADAAIAAAAAAAFKITISHSLTYLHECIPIARSTCIPVSYTHLTLPTIYSV